MKFRTLVDTATFLSLTIVAGCAFNAGIRLLHDGEYMYAYYAFLAGLTLIAAQLWAATHLGDE